MAALANAVRRMRRSFLVTAGRCGRAGGLMVMRTGNGW
jgi:hypothetical protein